MFIIIRNEQLVFVKYQSRWFICISLFHLHSSPMRYYYSHFTDKETDAQRSGASWSRSHHRWVAKVGFKFKQFGSRVHAFWHCVNCLSVKFISIQAEGSASFPHHAHPIVEGHCCEYAINHIWIASKFFSFRPFGSKELSLFPLLQYFYSVIFSEASLQLSSLTLNFCRPIKQLCVLIPSTCEQY